MGKFDRYILSQLMVLFGFFSLILILIYWINRAVILFDQLISDGQSALVFLEFTALSLPNIIRIVLPLSAFVAALYVTNRLSSDSELTVVQATGYSPWRLSRPVILFGLIVAALILILTHILVPAARYRLDIRSDEIASELTARVLDEGQFLEPATGVTVYIRDITPDGELLDIYLSDARDPDTRVTYTATRAYLVRTERGPQLVMRDGMAQTLTAESNRLIVTSFDDLAYDVGSFVDGADQRDRSMRQVPTWELFSPDADLVAETGKSRAALIAEAHDRFSQAFLAVPAVLIGFATLLVGSFSRFGVWRQVLVAVGLIAATKSVESVGASMALATPARWPMVYSAVVFGIGVSILLLWLAARPKRQPSLRGAA